MIERIKKGSRGIKSRNSLQRKSLPLAEVRLHSIRELMIFLGWYRLLTTIIAKNSLPRSGDYPTGNSISIG